MSAFYSVNCDKITHVATELTWVTNTDIKNNVAYQRAFGRTIEQNTDIGVRIENGVGISIGVVAKKEQLISNTKRSVALAPTIRTAVRIQTGGEVQVDAISDEAEIISSFITKLHDGSFYSCAFIANRLIADRVTSPEKTGHALNESNIDNVSNSKTRNKAAQRIVEDIAEYCIKPTDRFNVILHFVGLSEEDCSAIKMAFEDSPFVAESEQITVIHETNIDEELDELLANVPESELNFMRSIAKYVGKNADADKVKYILFGLVLLAAAYWLLSDPTNSNTGRKTSYKEFTPIEPVVAPPLENAEDKKTILSAAYLEQMRLEEINWITEHVRKSGYRPFMALADNVGKLNMSVSGYDLDVVVYDEPFNPNNASLLSSYHAKYVRSDSNIITDFTYAYPKANIALDGESAILSIPLKKSEREKPYAYEDSKGNIQIEELVASLQRLVNDNIIDTWKLTTAVLPKRPRHYTKEEEAFLKAGKKESEDIWIIPLNVYQLEIQFSRVATLYQLEDTLSVLKTATISKFSYNAKSQKAAIEVKIYEL